jgi:hypothetical protein
LPTWTSFAATASCRAFEVGSMLFVAFRGEELEVGRRILARAGARQDFSDQPAARVREEMHTRVLRQRAHERQRIGDRACAERAMIERVDPILVVIEDRRPRAADALSTACRT